jgi:SAM-dependent methyltransferase
MSLLPDLMREHARFALPSLGRDAARFGPGWLAGLEDLLVRLYPLRDGQRSAVRAYGLFTIDAMRRQRQFERSGHYPPRPPAGAPDALGDDRLREQYLPGLLLSHHLWPQHYRQLEFFRAAFVPQLAAAGCTRLLEVGIGTGLYLREALQALPQASGLGIDLSEAALAFSRRHAAGFELAGRLAVQRHDLLLERLAERYEALICVEVLEHLDAPLQLLRALRDQAQPNAYIFVSAALNAADVDHVYLYREPAALLAQVEAAGFRVEVSQLHEGRALGPAGVPVPAVLALILRPTEV